ncbi:MAG: M14 family zinc carboxypeptidase [Aestuariibacter sp.]
MLKQVFSNFSLLIVLWSLMSVSTATPLNEYPYFSTEEVFDDSVPTPESELGYPVGQWHVRHDQLVNYMTSLAENSNRVQIEQIGETHEQRKLLHLTISSPENLARIEDIRNQHLQVWQSGKRKQNEELPLVIWMGYSIHGDEASGSNAALLVAYYLAASKSEFARNLLDKAVIIFDPSLNPDGLSRFAHWANTHKSKNLVADRDNREHQQGWPSARTNHYWFDLNRDWLLLTHPESQARIKQFHKWRPHVLTDFHEMGSDSTFFFQPGIPSRTNPFTPEQNVSLTNLLGEYHAEALDDDKQFYFTKEGFDDFYYGKGSTYPDAHGSIGILFEQARVRGHLMETIHGPLHFQEAIKNQLTTSFSTFKGALENKVKLQQYQRSFVVQTAEQARDDKVAGYIFEMGNDRTRFNQLLDILQRHQIQVYQVVEDVEIDEQRFAAGQSYFVASEQTQYRLIKSLFSERKSFKDNTFYDVSSWNIAHAFNLRFSAVPDNRWRRLTLAKEQAQPLPEVTNSLSQDAVAYLFSWEDANAPRLLQDLLDENFKASISSKGFTADTAEGEWAFLPGTVVLRNDSEQPADAVTQLTELANAASIKIWSAMSGLTPTGSDLGSRHVKPIQSPNVLLVGGEGTSQYEVGEVWHYLDVFIGKSPSIVDLSRLAKVTLADYSHIIFVDGSYDDVSDKTSNKIHNWLQAGGVLIGQKKAAQWFAEKEWLKTHFADKEAIDKAFDTSTYQFGDRDQLAAKKRIAGAVFETQVDFTHPLLFGFTEKPLPMFKNSNLIMKKPAKPFLTPVTYTAAPLLAGYTSEELQKMVANTAAVVSHKVGKGRIVAFADNVNFRGYWRGTRRLMSNAIFMAPFISVSG